MHCILGFLRFTDRGEFLIYNQENFIGSLEFDSTPENHSNVERFVSHAMALNAEPIRDVDYDSESDILYFIRNSDATPDVRILNRS